MARGPLDIQNPPDGNYQGGSGVSGGTSTGSSAAVTRVGTSTTAASLLASNANRKELTVVNDSVTNLYVLLGSGTASITNYTIKLGPGESILEDHFTGAVSGILDTGTGNAQVTEVS